MGRSAWFVCLLVVSACGSDPGLEPPAASETQTAGAEQPAEAPVERVVAGEIARADLVPILDAGFGRFLQGVDTEPHLDEGAFVGFRLRSLYPADERFQRVDLTSGDTIIAVNGQSIERPEHALRVWNSLRVASELMVEYLRDGERREIRFAIVD